MTTIGIDLGTTNSAVSVWQDEEVQLVPNSLGEILTPSVVGIDDQKQIIVGRTARERLLTHSDKTVGVFKRLMGTKHEIRLGNKKYTAQELASFVLRSLKEDAEAYLGSPVVEAVISVPAYFNDHQRQATKLAGELAGLKIRRLINEPTAAALAYGLHEKKHGTFMVLDMGGGTFDVSILEYFDGIMEVHASAGDNFLGGEDFVDDMVTSVLQENQLKKDAIASGDLQKLSFKLERFKEGLDESESEIIRYKIGKKQFEWHATREWFDGIATPLLLRARRPIEKALADASLQPQEIDEMLLVGGATKLRNFREFVARSFKRFPSASIDPDTVVCVGAGVQAALVSKNESLSEVVLTDVCPYTLGTEVNGPTGGGQFFPIIERNATVSLSIAHTFCTASDNQRWVEFGVYQGENRLVEKNILLATLSIPVPKGPKGKEAIEVRYSYDVNGLLEVDATVISTGKMFNKVVENTSGGLSEREIAASRKKLSKMKYHPREAELNRSLIAKGERLYEMNLGEKREFVGNAIAEFEAILNRQNEMEIKKAQIALKALLDRLDEENWV